MRQFFVMLRGRRVGPYPQADIVRAVEAGRIDATAQVIDEVTGESMVASQLTAPSKSEPEVKEPPELVSTIKPAAKASAPVDAPVKKQTPSTMQHGSLFAAICKLWYDPLGTGKVVAFVGVACICGLLAFTIWGFQTKQTILTYEGSQPSYEVTSLLGKGWKIIDTHAVDNTHTVTRPAIKIGNKVWPEETSTRGGVVTTVTLERSNWSKLLND
jgi:hypothetical protein